MVYVVITIVTLLVLVFVVVWNLLNNKKENGFASVLLTTGIGLIVGSFGTFIDKIIQIISIVKSSNSAQDTMKISAQMSAPNILELIVGCVLTGFGVFFLVYIKKKIYILNINGYYDRRIEGHNEDVNLGTFDFKEREIDFIRIYKRGIDNSSAHEIREIIEEKVTSFKKESEHFRRGYTGIAPIPFVALAGSFIARETIHEYFEFDKKETQKFYRLSQKGRYDPLKVVTDMNAIDKDAEDVVIAVSVTAKITDADLAQFQGRNVIKLTIDKPDDNAIRCRSQLIAYKNEIISMVESIGKDMPNLKRIHLVCSCQSCLALELGKEIDDRRAHQVIFYFFDIQKKPRYPWGIVINGDQKGSYVQA